MNDALHSELCRQFMNETWQLSHKKIIKLVDTDKYIELFTYHNKTTGNDLLTKLYNSNSVRVILYIVTSRRLGTIANTTQLFHSDLYLILNCITKIAHITKFFSFYNDTEINNIITGDILDSSICHNNIFIINSLLFCYITCKDDLFFRYILDYVDRYNISVIVPTNNNRYNYKYKYSNLLSKYPYQMNLIADHEIIIIFRRSLRYAWITICLL